jgi:hypothetical protein
MAITGCPVMAMQVWGVELPTSSIDGRERRHVDPTLV